MLKASNIALIFEPTSLALPVDLQARDAFFVYYVTSTSKSWDFLKRYYHPIDAPEHLTLAIEAVSLAYLWHQIFSETALATARERYVLALRMTNIALDSHEEAAKDTTLLASLLLDLFEKITGSKSQNGKSWKSHINGALALVSLRGLERFQDPAAFRILVRLSTNYLITCVASSLPVSEELIAVRTYIGKYLDVQDPKWQLSDLMVLYANLLSDVRKGVFSQSERVARFEELDIRLKALDLDMPPSWKASTAFLNVKSERTFQSQFDSYADRNVTQARNVLRCVRIFLNESLIWHYRASSMNEEVLPTMEKAFESITMLTTEICGSIPQYVDCDGPARAKLPSSETLKTMGGHLHTPNHVLDCYTLLFPLYVAGQPKFSPRAVKPWAIKQLRYISKHFGVRNAEIVTKTLEAGQDTNPWDVYAIPGSYAFAA